MKKWKILDSLGETIGYIESTNHNEKAILEKAWKMFPFDKPKVKPCT